MKPTPTKARKEKSDANQGIAADIAVSNGTERMNIVKDGGCSKFNGIGVAKTFVHVDTRQTTPVMWTYS